MAVLRSTDDLTCAVDVMSGSKEMELEQEPAAAPEQAPEQEPAPEQQPAPVVPKEKKKRPPRKLLHQRNIIKMYRKPCLSQIVKAGGRRSQKEITQAHRNRLRRGGTSCADSVKEAFKILCECVNEATTTLKNGNGSTRKERVDTMQACKRGLIDVFKCLPAHKRDESAVRYK